jgi:acyl-coenzyme A synthetase/AMP-(fatty) acid ligase
VRNTNYVEFGPQDVVGQIANTSFDAITFEVFGALLNGARLVIFPEDDILSPRRFRAATHRWGITKMFVTAALFDVIVRAEPDAFARMDTLIVGGDALNVKTIRQLLSTAPPRLLVNGYGPTEATTFSVCHEIQSVPEDASSIPIGRPIANSTAYVLDQYLRPVPIGVQGELYLGGDGVALGYLNRPELTAERFPVDPFSASPSGNPRLYKTGDLARWTPEGVIEFFGRTDHQVKFNGFRIELGEIETALRNHPAVADALVMMRTDFAGYKTLVAYTVRIAGTTEGPGKSESSEIRQWLAARIPAFMLPNTIISLKQFPLTSRGKVDRNALPDPESFRPASSIRMVVATEDTPEARVRSTWKEVLHLEDLDLDASFFDLGGTSLKLALVEEQLQSRWGYEVTATDLFRFPTVRSLAMHLGGGGPGQLERDGAVSARAARQRAAYSKQRQHPKANSVFVRVAAQENPFSAEEIREGAAGN